jgi:hypothetical protein
MTLYSQSLFTMNNNPSSLGLLARGFWVLMKV